MTCYFRGAMESDLDIPVLWDEMGKNKLQNIFGENAIIDYEALIKGLNFLLEEIIEFSQASAKNGHTSILKDIHLIRGIKYDDELLKLSKAINFELNNKKNE